jgi:hypothetical protein
MLDVFLHQLRDQSLHWLYHALQHIAPWTKQIITAGISVGMINNTPDIIFSDYDYLIVFSGITRKFTHITNCKFPLQNL